MRVCDDAETWRATWCLSAIALATADRGRDYIDNTRLYNY